MAIKQFTSAKLKNGGVVKLSTVSEEIIIRSWGGSVSGLTLSDMGFIGGSKLFTANVSPTYELSNGSTFQSTLYRENNRNITMKNPNGYYLENAWGFQCYDNELYLIGGIRDDVYYYGIITKFSGGIYYIRISNHVMTESFWKGSASDSKDVFDVNGGSSTTGGGGGDFDNTSQPVDFPSLPSISAVDSGFITLYNPTLPQLQQLSSFMWSTDFVDNLLKLWADPMETILNLSLVPVNIPSSVNRDVVVGNVSTGINMGQADSQFMYVDCGTINVNEYWGAYLDYSPYTKLSIVLPYVGTHQLNIDECMGKSVHVKYIIDILSGACVAFVKCGESVLYSFSGNCATNIPVTSANYSRTMQAILSGVTSAVGGAVTGNPVGIASGVGSVAGAVATCKPSIERSGSLGGNVGLLAHQYPYLILERPRQCVPEKQNEYSGYPAFITEKLSNISGFTVVDRINLQNVNITEPEKAELIDILKRGVYF